MQGSACRIVKTVKYVYYVYTNLKDISLLAISDPQKERYTLVYVYITYWFFFLIKKISCRMFTTHIAP